MSSNLETILVLDFGSQYTQLIGRRIREANVYSEIVPFNTPLDVIRAHQPRGIILSGGPDSVYETGAPACDPQHLRSRHSDTRRLLRHAADRQGTRRQESSHRRSGNTARGKSRSTGPSCLLDGMKRVWMSHGDRILEPPSGFSVTARSNTAMAAMENPSRKIFGIQFHPEVTHTDNGSALLPPVHF